MAARFAGALRAVGVQAGDRVALICSNRIEFLQVYPRLRLARRHRGADQYRVARPAAAAHPGELAARACLIIEPAYLEQSRRIWTLRRCQLATIWDDRRASRGSRGRPAVAADAAARRSDRSGAAAAGRSAGDPLYLGDDRAVEGRVLPACPVFLVGRQYRARILGHRRRRRAVHHAAAVPHQRAQHVLSGAAERRAHGRYERRASRPPAFWRASTARDATRHLPARRHGADPAVAGSRATTSAPPRAHRARARRAGACFHAAFAARTGIRLLDGYGSTETNFVHRHDDRPAEARH